jgi:hypothetical protein
MPTRSRAPNTSCVCAAVLVTLSPSASSWSAKASRVFLRHRVHRVGDDMLGDVHGPVADLRGLRGGSGARPCTIRASAAIGHAHSRRARSLPPGTRIFEYPAGAGCDQRRRGGRVDAAGGANRPRPRRRCGLGQVVERARGDPPSRYLGYRPLPRDRAGSKVHCWSWSWLMASAVGSDGGGRRPTTGASAARCT